MIYVTRPFLPDLQELIPLLEDIWSNRALTNQGPFHQRFEQELATFLEGGMPDWNGAYKSKSKITKAEADVES